MKFFPVMCFMLFSISTLAQHSQDLEGTWRWTSPSGDHTFELLLEYDDNNILRGKHCSVFEDGEKADCRREDEDFSVNLVKIARNIYDGTIESGLSATSGRIRLQYNPKEVSLVFVLKAMPPGEFYLPAEAILFR